MKMILYILEMNTGKEHKRNLPYRSCEAKAHTTRGGNTFIIVSDYYTGEQIKKVNISSYGSCRFWIERKGE